MKALFISAHNAVVTCSVFAPNPNRILDQILRNTTEPRSPEAAEAQLQDEADHAAEDTRSEPTSVDRAAAAVGARSKHHSKAAKHQPQHHVREDSILMSFPVDHKICVVQKMSSYYLCLSAMTIKVKPRDN